MCKYSVHEHTYNMYFGYCVISYPVHMHRGKVISRVIVVVAVVVDTKIAKSGDVRT